MKYCYSLSLALLILSSCTTAQTPHPRKLKFPPLKFEPPKAEERTLSNGIKVILVENHELPTFQMALWVRGGYQNESLDKIGLGGLFQSVMREGGTKSRKPDALNQELESMAATVETWVNEEAAGMRCSSLKKYMDQTLDLFCDVLFNPVFSEDKLRQRKQESIEGIRRRNDRPRPIATREFRTSLYGSKHPSGWRTEPETINAITRSDLVSFHKKYFIPKGAMISASGDFNTDEFMKKLEKLLGGWTGEAPKMSAPAQVKKEFKRRVILVEKEVAQSTIRIGHLGLKRHNPHRYAYIVLNEILGGASFTSRFVREIRSRRGLAYSVWSYFTEGRDYGMILGGGQTKAESTAQTIELMLQMMKEITEKPVTDQELTLAKQSIINSFVFRFDSLARVVRQQLHLKYYGYPDDYLQNYTRKIESVTKEDVLRVAGKFLHPEQTVILVVGNSKKFDKPLSAFGKVETIKLRDYRTALKKN